MADWDAFHRKVRVEEPHPEFVRFFKKHLAGKEGIKVLDSGCGTGRHALYLAERGVESHGVDISPAALRSLRAKARKKRLKIKTAKADIGKLPYSNAYFDATISVNVLNHGMLSELRGYFRETYRVLKPGGLLFLIVSPKSLARLARKTGMRILEKNTYLNLNLPDGDIPHHLFTKRELKELLRGYDIISVRTIRDMNPWLKKKVDHTILTARKR